MPAFLFKLETEDGAPDRAGREAAGAVRLRRSRYGFEWGRGQCPRGAAPLRCAPTPLARNGSRRIGAVQENLSSPADGCPWATRPKKMSWAAQGQSFRRWFFLVAA